MKTAILFLTLCILLVVGSTKVSAGIDASKNKQLPKDKVALYQQLDDDFEELLKTERNQEPLREAARLLAETNQNSHWMNFYDATALIRRHRSKAAIPLLMKYMIEHSPFSTAHSAISNYIDTLRILTGERLTLTDLPEKGVNRQQSIEAAVIKMYVEWWQPNKKHLTTDLGKMAEDRVKFVVSELLRHSDREFERYHYALDSDRLVSTQALHDRLAASFRKRSGRQGWWKEELHGRMTTILLDLVGYTSQPPNDPTAGSTRIAYAAIPMLAVLRQEGQAQILDKVAEDQKQNNATRLTCILALHFASEDMNIEAVVSILDTDPRLECRVLSLLTLGLSDKNAVAVPKLVAALKDNNQEIRLAAMQGLEAFAPQVALSNLSSIVRDGEPSELVRPSIKLLGRIGGDDAASVLAEYLEKTLKPGGNKSYALYYALNAFSEATKTRWTEEGAHDDSYYIEKAEAAINWWKTHKK
ncbi:MAG: HEAT repeat domain-containing protein [Acidobacteriota bacterium]